MKLKGQFLSFLAAAHRNTYAAPPQTRKKYRCKDPILPGHKDYHFADKEGKEWEYHDSYAGTNWAPGREVVFYKGKPFWTMSYQGKHDESLPAEFFQEEAFVFLRKALMAFTDDCPLRGRDDFREGDFVYHFVIDGDWTYFTGRESITYKAKEIFFQHVMGELVK